MPASPPDLAGQISARGDSAQLVSVNLEGRPHVVAVRVAADGDALTVEAGDKTRANVAAHPGVTLLWGPPPGEEYTLVVDGDATAGDGVVTIRPSFALLHRLADATGGGPRCYAVDVSAGPG